MERDKKTAQKEAAEEGEEEQNDSCSEDKTSDPTLLSLPKTLIDVKEYLNKEPHTDSYTDHSRSRLYRSVSGDYDLSKIPEMKHGKLNRSSLYDEGKSFLQDDKFGLQCEPPFNYCYKHHEFHSDTGRVYDNKSENFSKTKKDQNLNRIKSFINHLQSFYKFVINKWGNERVDFSQNNQFYPQNHLVYTALNESDDATQNRYLGIKTIDNIEHSSEQSEESHCECNKPSPHHNQLKNETKLNKPNERVDVYYFDHGNSAYFRTTDPCPRRLTEKVIIRTETCATRFWSDVFGVLNVIVSFFVVFFIQMFKFILSDIIRELTVGILRILADYLFKPLLAIIFNGYLQPLLILGYNVAMSVRDFSQPIAQALGFFLKELAVLFGACRLIEVKRIQNPQSNIV